MKIYKGQFSAKDLLEVAMDSRMRVSSTPFGAPPGERTIVMGKAVAWKGVVGIEAVRAANARVAAGLEKAIAVSRRHTEPGTALVQYPNGEIITMPMKAYAMMAEAARPVSLISSLAAKRPWLAKKAPAAPVLAAPAR